MKRKFQISNNKNQIRKRKPLKKLNLKQENHLKNDWEKYFFSQNIFGKNIFFTKYNMKIDVKHIKTTQLKPNLSKYNLPKNIIDTTL